MEQKDINQINDKLDDIIAATCELQKLAEKVEKHERILRGGNGEALGLSARVVNLEKIAEANHTLLFGDGEKPGLKGRVQEIANTLASYNKFLWIVMAAAIGSLLSIWIR